MSIKGEKVGLFFSKATEWSAYMLFLFIPFSKSLIEIFAIAAMVSWVLKKLFSGKKEFPIVKTELNLPLAFFYTVSALSILWSTHPDISIKALIRKLTEYIMLYFIIVETVSSKRVAINMLRLLTLALFLVCIDGIYQKLVGFDFVRNYPLYSLDRMTAAFKFPNGLSAWLLIASFPSIGIAFFFNDDLRLKALHSVLAALSCAVLFLARVRGAIISFTAGLFLIFLLRRSRLSYAVCVIIIIGLVLSALLFPDFLNEHFSLSKILEDCSGRHRLRMWVTGWRMFIDRPFTGQGLNTFMANYSRFKPQEEIGVWYAHNCFLQIAAETGIFGLLAFLWMIAAMVVSSVKSWVFMKDNFFRFAHLGLFCGIISFLLHSGVETSLYSLRLAVMFYCSLGLLMGMKRIGIAYGKP